MTREIFDKLVSEGETDLVDFKESSYFAATDPNKELDFIKDVLALTNTVRSESAYILIGITDNGVKKGIDKAEIIDNSKIQSKIRDKVNPIPHFKSYPYHEDGLTFQIIEIPVCWYPSPCVPIVTKGNLLERKEIYVRRNTSNEKASYDEIIKIESWLKSLPKLEQLTPKGNIVGVSTGFKFDEVTIQKLFGNEAAEDEDIERLKEYYFKNDIFDKIAVDLPLRILVGHKGIGKSALFNVSMSEDKELGRLSIKIKPEDVSYFGQEGSSLSSIISEWKHGLLKLIYTKAQTTFFSGSSNHDNHNLSPETILDKIVDELLKIQDQGRIIEKQNGLLEKFLSEPIINVYIDDLDRGWEGTKADITKISALLNAVRDIINDGSRRIQFKISLRSDVYFLYRTSDESTDKTQSSVIWYKWTHHEILCVLVKRVKLFFGKEADEAVLKSLPQSALSKDLNEIIEPRFSGEGKWENKEMYKILLSVIRKRPRDLVKLLTLAARHAHERRSNIIRTEDLKGIFDEYSLDRIQDTINEYKSELPQIERLIFGMKPAKKTYRAADNFYYSTSSLILKINKIIERGDFKFSNGKTATPKELAAFLYKINFITATKKLEDSIERKDFEENRYLVPKFEDFGYDWEVHMAFRWGLDPSNRIEVYSPI